MGTCSVDADADVPTELMEFDFSNCLVNAGDVDQLLPALSAMRSVKSLSLTQDSLGPAGAGKLSAVLPQMPDLEILDLYDNAIGVYMDVDGSSDVVVGVQKLAGVL